MQYEQLLFSELRLVPAALDSVPLTEENLVRAMTVNEELLALGYTLAPKDITALAKSADLNVFADRVRAQIGDVKAKPMYPDFPQQVMEMDEAVFRFHQMLHYLSTYGVEEISGIPVTRGWLPEMQDTEKTKADTALLNAKTIALVAAEKQYSVPYRIILSKTERMTDKELMLLTECVKHLTPEELTGISVTFKQNLLVIYQAVFAAEGLSSAEKCAALHALCQHTGDVWKCLDYALTRARFHFRTAQKRLTVKLLESYPLSDFRENLILSGKKAERTLLMLKFIDFNAYTRKPGYAEAVAELRAGTLRSWESGAKALVAAKSPEALTRYAERPGMMLRHLTYLLRAGYRSGDIYKLLEPKAGALKTQTLISLYAFSKRPETAALSDDRFMEARTLSLMLLPLINRRLAAYDTVLKCKRVCVQIPDFDLEQSEIRVGTKSAEGGYIRSGLAYRIPEAVKRLRFFVYWNDKERVDIDLHGYAVQKDGGHTYIGWNSDFKNGALVSSGDITHSDAAEYIDIDLEKAEAELTEICINLHLYAGREVFGEVEECFVGAMAVDQTGADIKLYDPKNCFFAHHLTSPCSMLNYGYVDVANRVIVFDGLPNDENYYSTFKRNNAFSVRQYLDVLFQAQNAEKTDDPNEADVILVMGKPSGEKEVSLIDSNFFMDPAK